MFNFDFNPFKKLVAKYEGLMHSNEDFNTMFLEQQTLQCVGDIKMDTPVDTGNLRNRWETSAVRKLKKGFGVANTYEIDIINPADYASFVEDGHWTTGLGVKQRWVPGSWQGNKFKYDPNAKTGMLLKSKFIEGKHMAKININKLEWRLEKNYDTAFKQFLKEKGL